MSLRKIIPGLFCILCLMFLATCSPATVTSTGTTTPTSSNVPADNLVIISNFAYSPASLTVNVGTTVTWINKDSVNHTVTSDNSTFGSDMLATNASFTYKFDASGIFPYHCIPHPYMKGTIVVR
jgi:plastocyanin